MYKIYQIEIGETLDSIAKKLSTDIETLKQINGINNDVSLIPGSFIIVPMVDNRFQNYIIEKGDTIYSIATKYKVDPKLLLKLNGLEEDTYIYPGQKIIIPNNMYKFYITEKGDTIDDIVKNTKTSIPDLLNSNETIYVEPDQTIIYK